MKTPTQKEFSSQQEKDRGKINPPVMIKGPHFPTFHQEEKWSSLTNSPFIQGQIMYYNKTMSIN